MAASTSRSATAGGKRPMRRRSVGQSATTVNTPRVSGMPRTPRRCTRSSRRRVVPEFLARDAAGMPRRWLERVRRSMATLTPTYSSSRMARDYVEQYYLIGAAELRRRTADGGEPARAMQGWEAWLRRHWSGLHIGETSLSRDGTVWSLSVPVYLGEIAPADIAVQFYADPRDAEAPFLGELLRGEAIIGATNGHIYTGAAPATRPAEEYTVRILPHYPGVRVPTELPLILWQK